MRLIDAIRGFFRGLRSGYRKVRSARLQEEINQQSNPITDKRETVGVWETLADFIDMLIAFIEGTLKLLIMVAIVGVLIYALVAFIKWCWQNS